MDLFICFPSSEPPGKLNAPVCNMAGTSSFAPPKLADFILTERLGRGTYATVYKAYRKVSLDAASMYIVQITVSVTIFDLAGGQ